MSEREFENYLQLLRGLLRLNRDQSEALSAELRSHMEERLEELLARGISREEAIQQALAEFGDAAGLGQQFGAISLSRKRRWLMRLMTFSTAATLLIAASLITFWPGRNAAPGLSDAVAQAPQALPIVPHKTDNEQNVQTRPSANDRIEAELNKTTSVDFVDVPLKDVCAFLSENHKIPIFIRKKKLAEASVSVDTPVTISLRGVPLRTVLEFVLEESELTYDIRDVLIITTPEDAESRLWIRVYDCRDLLAMPAPEVPAAKIAPPTAPSTTIPSPPSRESESPASSAGVQPATAKKGGGGMGGTSSSYPPPTELDKRIDGLIEIITSTVGPDSWDDVGGPGAIDAYNGLFVVSQTTGVHRQIEHVLDMLREAAGLEVKAGKVIR